MTSWPAAAALARALTMLERARTTGELEASGVEGRARLLVVEGRVVRVDAPTAPSPRLGHLLVEGGAPREAIERAVDAREGGVTTGDAVVRAGVVGRGAVSHALRLQMRARVRSVASWQTLDLRFERGRVSASLPLAEPTTTGDLMIGAMREALVDMPSDVIRARLSDGDLVLTPLGQALVAGAPLWPDEQALCAVLRRPSSLTMLESACRGSERGLRLLFALRALEGAAPVAAANLALLARKAREARRARSAEQLLDLPRGARPAEAKAAWRKLTASLHPDRFAGSPAALAQVSNEVTLALNGAAARLRASR